MTNKPFPIIGRAPKERRVPVVVSVPHFGIEPLPGIVANHYREPGYATFPRGYTDAFAAEVYGDLHHAGASLVATPYSRLFVDVNRRRDDFECRGDEIVSGRGVVRTHVLDDRPIFTRPLGPAQIEDRLRRFYDPYHTALDMLVDEAAAHFGTVVVLDAHTASPRRMGDHEVVIGSRRGGTADPCLVAEVVERFRAHGFHAERDVPGYAGGYITQRFGRRARSRSHAIQIEINAGVLMSTTITEHRKRLHLGRPPLPDPEAVDRARRCLEDVVRGLARLVSTLEAGPSNRAEARKVRREPDPALFRRR